MDSPIGLLYALEGILPQKTSQRILVTKNTRARASKSLPDTRATTLFSKSLAILSGLDLKVNSFQGALPFSPGLPPASLGWAALLQWMTPGAQFHHSRYRDLNNYCHHIGYFGWGSMCPFSFRAKKSSVPYLTSKDFVQTLSKQSN